MIEDYLLGDGSVDWKKVNRSAIEFRQNPKLRLDEILDYLKEKDKVTDYLREDALILFRPDDGIKILFILKMNAIGISHKRELMKQKVMQKIFLKRV
ncbi:MAG: hypothetical protein PVJ67_02185 [Candidatus Pacearchaeota archaeon]|jgi:hypothetical protein